MARVSTLLHYTSVLIIADLGLRVQAFCNAPITVAGTRYNDSLTVYQPGDVLSVSCDTGYKSKYNPPTTTCLHGLDEGFWKPPAISSCELDMDSLVIAVVVALVAILIFAVIIVIILKRGRRQRRALTPKVIRRSPQFPEHPPETFEMSRPGSLYDSVRITAGHTGGMPDPNHQRGIYDALNGLENIRGPADESTNGLANPNLILGNDGIDIIDAGGLKLTGALKADSSRKHDYENVAGEKKHNYENTPLEKTPMSKNRKLFH